MSLKIAAQSLAHELPAEAADELIGRLNRGGIVKRIPATGEIVGRSPMAALAHKLTELRDSGATFGPQPDEQGILYVVLDHWLYDVGDPAFPESAMELRYALYSDIDERHGHDAAPATS